MTVKKVSTASKVAAAATGTQRDRLDKRLSELESQALSLEERARYAEKEALLRKRIQAAQDKIRSTQPLGMWDSLAMRDMIRRLPTSLKVVFVVIGVIVLLPLLGKSCG